MIPGYHGSVDREGHATENTCPCPQEPCGLIDPARALPECIHHGANHPPKPTANGHPADACPGTPDPAEIIIGPLFNATLRELTGRRAARRRVADRVLSALAEHGYRLQHRSDHPDERAIIAADLEARAKAIEDSAGENGDWLAEQFYDHLPVVAIGAAIQADPRTVAVEAYRNIAFLITTETGAPRSTPDAPTRAPEAPQAPQDPPAGIPGPPDSAETITAPRDDQVIAAEIAAKEWCQHLAKDLARHLQTSTAPDAATWSEALEWFAKRIKGGHLSIYVQQDFEKRFGGPVQYPALNAAEAATEEPAHVNDFAINTRATDTAAAQGAPPDGHPKIYSGEPQATPPVIEPAGPNADLGHRVLAAAPQLQIGQHAIVILGPAGDRNTGHICDDISLAWGIATRTHQSREPGSNVYLVSRHDGGTTVRTDGCAIIFHLPSQPSADELYVAAAKLRAFAASTKPVALCHDCGVRGEPEPELEGLLAAREPLAELLQGAAVWADRYSADRSPLRVARAINGTTGEGQ